MQKTPPAETARPARNRPAFFRRWDVWVVAALLAVGGVWLALTLLRPAGALATISVADTGGETTVQEVRLGRDQIIHVEEAPFPVTLEVRGGAIRFVDSQCPDHRCEDFGWLSHEGEWALCAPGGVMVRVVKDG